MDYQSYFQQHPFDTMAPWIPAPAYSPTHQRPWNHIIPRVDPKSGSSITMDKDKFQVHLDVHQFAPDEIKVKTIDRHIIVEGKHEDKPDQHGSVARHFVRKYLLPDGHHSEDVQSTLSADGILCITTPKRKDSEDNNERLVPIAMVPALNGHIKTAGEQNDDKKENGETIKE